MDQSYNLFGKISAGSKYYSTQFNPEDPFFPVTITPRAENYIYEGGPGGRYRREDVDIYVQTNGRMIRIGK